MPDRRYPAWDMDDDARRELSEHMNAGMYSGVPPGDAIEGIVGQVGKDPLIAMLSGTTDRSTRQWKNARDNLSRWRRGARHPKPASQQRLRAAAESNRRSAIRSTGRAHVRVEATFRTSKNVWGYADCDLTGPALDDFLSAREAGDDELAAQIVSEGYGLDPAFVLGLGGVTGFEMTWEEPEPGR
jgi:hypothetical protein